LASNLPVFLSDASVLHSNGSVLRSNVPVISFRPSRIGLQRLCIALRRAGISADALFCGARLIERWLQVSPSGVRRLSNCLPLFH
jgi:hypothetical protein